MKRSLCILLLAVSAQYAFAEEEKREQKNTTEQESVTEKERQLMTEIIITADPLNHNLLEHSSPVSVLEKKELLLNTETTIGETIGKQPGVSTSYFGPGASRPIIRGNAGDRVRVLKNGIGTLDVSNTSEDHAVSTNPITAESIEILRGPETLLFGSSAIGGVVNITDTSIPKKSFGKLVTGAVDLRAGTNDDEATGAAKLEGSVENFNYHLDYFHQKTNDIEIPGTAVSDKLVEQQTEQGEEVDEGENGTLFNSGTRSQGYTAGGSYVWDKGYFGVSVNRIDSTYGVPGLPEEGHGDEEEEGEVEAIIGEAEEEEGVSIDLDQRRVDLQAGLTDISETIESINFKLGLSKYEHVELEGSEIGTTFDNDAAESRVEVKHSLAESLDGVVGLQLQVSDFSATGEEAFLPATDTFSPGIFIFEELEFDDHWIFQAGARYDLVNYNADGFSQDTFNPFALSAGATWDVNANNDYTVGLSFAFTQRAPSSTELYADGAHIARQIFEQGDPDLAIEQSYGFDLTFKKNTGFITGALNLFGQNYDNYINLGSAGFDEDSFPVFNYEDIQARFFGFETEAVMHLHEPLGLYSHDIDLDLQLDYVRARSISDSGDLPRIPPFRTIVGLDYGYKSLLSARVEGVFVAAQTKIDDGELPTDNYGMLNAHMYYNLFSDEHKKLSLYVKGSNLNNVEARVHSSFLKEFAPLRGRNVLFGLRGEF